MSADRLWGILPSLLFIVCVSNATRMWIDDEPVRASISAAVAVLALIQVIEADR